MDKMPQCFVQMLATFFILSLYIVLTFKKYVNGHEVPAWAKQLIINDAYYVKRRETFNR